LIVFLATIVSTPHTVAALKAIVQLSFN